MPQVPIAAATDWGQMLAEAFALNESMNQLVLEHLDPRAWREKPAGGKGRTIAAIFSHVHNIRLKWLRLSAPHLKPVPPLNHARCTQQDVAQALSESAQQCREMLKEALSPAGRVKAFRRDGWARRWPPGAAMLAYMITHDAHHRGQVCLLARQLGYPLRGKSAHGLWSWEALAKQCGIARLQ